MSLGSLYRQAPNGTFRKTNFEDKRMIEVPLGEVFKNINPGRLHGFRISEGIQAKTDGLDAEILARFAEQKRPDPTPLPSATQVQVTCDGKTVARHDRCWARHQSITDPVHRRAAEELRAAHRLASVTPIATPVEARDLADYDRMFGLDDQEVA